VDNTRQTMDFLSYESVVIMRVKGKADISDIFNCVVAKGDCGVKGVFYSGVMEVNCIKSMVSIVSTNLSQIVIEFVEEMLNSFLTSSNSSVIVGMVGDDHGGHVSLGTYKES